MYFTPDQLQAMDPSEVDSHMLRRIQASEQGGPDQRMVARRGQDLLTNHRPVGDVAARTCTVCGTTWPCGGYYYVLASD